MIGGRQWSLIGLKRSEISFSDEFVPIFQDKVRLLPSQWNCAVSIDYALRVELDPAGPGIEIPFVFGTTI